MDTKLLIMTTSLIVLAAIILIIKVNLHNVEMRLFESNIRYNYKLLQLDNLFSKLKAIDNEIKYSNPNKDRINELMLLKAEIILEIKKILNEENYD